jgi:bacillithiol system protein YtxJ
MALNRLERKWRESNISAYYLDLIAYREISNIVADEFGVQHQSPQVLLISGGDVIYHSSHNGIDFDEINSIAMELPTV